MTQQSWTCVLVTSIKSVHFGSSAALIESNSSFMASYHVEDLELPWLVGKWNIIPPNIVGTFLHILYSDGITDMLILHDFHMILGDFQCWSFILSCRCETLSLLIADLMSGNACIIVQATFFILFNSITLRFAGCTINGSPCTDQTTLEPGHSCTLPC